MDKDKERKEHALRCEADFIQEYFPAGEFGADYS